MDEGLDGVDVVMMLRLQRERMRGALLPSEQVILSTIWSEQPTSGQCKAGCDCHASWTN